MYKRLEKIEYIGELWIEDGDSIQLLIDKLVDYPLKSILQSSDDYYYIKFDVVSKRLETDEEYNKRIDGLKKENKKDKENKKKLREKLIKDLEKEGYLVTKKEK